MPRKSKGPRWWKTRKQYVVTIRGRKHYLGPDKAKADERYHMLMLQKEPDVSSDLAIVIFDKFLDWTEKHREPSTFEWYEARLTEFANEIPKLAVEQVKPHHVQAWIDTKKSNAHKRGCAIAVTRAFNWAVKQGLIDKNPIRGMEKPPASQRTVVLPQDQYHKILSFASDQEFHDLLTFCWETGCRPQEAFRLEGRHLDLSHSRCVFAEEESKGKKKKRIIYLNAKALEIVQRLAQKHPSGPLLRNEDGNPWHRNNVACRFGRMKKKLGFKGKLYFMRHTFLTNGLKAGIDPITLAELAGHNDVSMLARQYAHVREDTDHMQKALTRMSKPKDESP